MTTTKFELARDEGTELVVREIRATAPMAFTPEQQQLIRDMFANGASPTEFEALMEIARARRLNPLLKQIYFVQRWDSKKRREIWAAQISIDGLRAVAERTGKYTGQDEPEYLPSDSGSGLLCCKVRVYRRDWPRPAVGVAYWDEYAQKTKDGETTAFWKRMPHVMLAKCAEALAIRKAFPEDTSGLYVAEEMGQDPRDESTIAEITTTSPRPALEAPAETPVSVVESAPTATVTQLPVSSEVSERTRARLAELDLDGALDETFLRWLAGRSGTTRDPIWRLYADRLTALLADTDDASMVSLASDLQALPKELVDADYAAGLRAQIARTVTK